jgi:hypothetical protein
MNGTLCTAVPYKTLSCYNIPFICASDELKTWLPPPHRPSRSSLTHCRTFRMAITHSKSCLVTQQKHSWTNTQVTKRIRTRSIKMFTALECLPGSCNIWQHLLYFCRVDRGSGCWRRGYSDKQNVLFVAIVPDLVTELCKHFLEYVVLNVYVVLMYMWFYYCLIM